MLIGIVEGILVTTLLLKPTPIAGAVEKDEVRVVVVEVTVEEEETPSEEEVT